MGNLLLIVGFLALCSGVCVYFKTKEPELFIPILVWEILNFLIAVLLLGPWGPWGVI